MLKFSVWVGNTILYEAFPKFDYKHTKMFHFKFQQNRTINEEFDFWGGEGGPDF